MLSEIKNKSYISTLKLLSKSAAMNCSGDKVIKPKNIFLTYKIIKQKKKGRSVARCPKTPLLN